VWLSRDRFINQKHDYGGGGAGEKPTSLALSGRLAWHRRQAPSAWYHQRTRLVRDEKKILVVRWPAAAVLADGGRQFLIGRLELVPPRVGIAALTPGEVGGEIFDMDLSEPWKRCMS